VRKTSRRSLDIPTRSAPPRNPLPLPLTHINTTANKGKICTREGGPNQNTLRNNEEKIDENQTKLWKTIIWHAIYVPKEIFPNKIRQIIPPKI
jgi:hypothetical protein